jgi:hypothetical protein
MKRVWVLGSVAVAFGAAMDGDDAATENTSTDRIGQDKPAGLGMRDIIFMTFPD